ncbi:helix-turn-helix domain-containing protein [Lyngbya confervoides]|uniref:Helix-turn-helix domain-containing protein n=1 Tax=Lyngbya confervoides BDU141951 TaxID=1574623 RepID=A0ABD4T6J0_9CYAN|nr:helix-turn-helix transcriptional regulator [Lyngbya confervoides]MCM1983860.1 helix-turn-helix domain-containing protein [Lyngbya confervoides BDU141951]
MYPSPSSHSDAAQSFVAIGQRLQQLRLDQGLELDQISRRTRISVRHLTAIEAGQRSALPELVYIRSFIRQYAQTLQQDPASFDLSCLETSNASTRGRRFLNPTTGLVSQKMQYLLYGLLVMLVGGGLIYWNNREFQPEPVNSLNQVPVVETGDSPS